MVLVLEELTVLLMSIILELFLCQEMLSTVSRGLKMSEQLLLNVKQLLLTFFSHSPGSDPSSN